MHTSRAEGTALMGGCLYSSVSNDSCCALGCCVFCGSFVVCWVCIPWVRVQFLYCSSVVCLYLDVFIGGFRWGMTLGVGEAMLMRGGACATELCLMDGWVCVIVSNRCGLHACELWKCGFRVECCLYPMWSQFGWFRSWEYNFQWVGFTQGILLFGDFWGII